MITLRIQVKNLDQLRSNFAKAPKLALKYLARATSAAIFEVEKQAVDRNFQFKTPRALRTGMLGLSFAYGRYIAPGGLRASIGPTVHYAPTVYRANRYMDRIARAAKPAVGKHFEKAIDLFISHIAKT